MTTLLRQALADRDGAAAPSIQPHGCLLVCTMPGWAVVAGSGNCAGVIGRGPGDVIGAPLDAVLPHQLVHDLRNVLQTAMGSGRTEHLLDVGIEGVGRFDLALHIVGNQAIIEFLPRPVEGTASQDPGLLIRSMAGRLIRASTLDRCLTLAVNQVRAVTGFDRVIVSKLSGDDTGQVVSEALRAGLPPFLGLRYHISDLPTADRALFRRAGLRSIPDTAAEPVPILTGSAEIDVPDLALASLRGVEPERLADLHSLGARAALTIPLVAGDGLWGLMTCHHATPRALPTSTATLLDLFGQILSMQIGLKEAGARQRADDAAAAAAERLAGLLPLAGSLADDFPRWAGTLREVIPCDGLGLWFGGLWVGAELTPPPAAREKLLGLLAQDRPKATVVSTDRLSHDVQDPESGVRGCLMVRLRRNRPDALLFFRRETVETWVWGLDPDRPRDVGGASSAPGSPAEPRGELRRGCCAPWMPVDLRVADRIRTTLLEALLDQAE